MPFNRPTGRTGTWVGQDRIMPLLRVSSPPAEWGGARSRNRTRWHSGSDQRTGIGVGVGFDQIFGSFGRSMRVRRVRRQAAAEVSGENSQKRRRGGKLARSTRHRGGQRHSGDAKRGDRSGSTGSSTRSRRWCWRQKAKASNAKEGEGRPAAPPMSRSDRPIPPPRRFEPALLWTPPSPLSSVLPLPRSVTWIGRACGPAVPSQRSRTWMREDGARVRVVGRGAGEGVLCESGVR